MPPLPNAQDWWTTYSAKNGHRIIACGCSTYSTPTPSIAPSTTPSASSTPSTRSLSSAPSHSTLDSNSTSSSEDALPLPSLRGGFLEYPEDDWDPPSYEDEEFDSEDEDDEEWPTWEEYEMAMRRYERGEIEEEHEDEVFYGDDGKEDGYYGP
jgi:hypothetical protein